MTESTAPAAATTAKTSFWEDVIDIFISPAAVFRRREFSSFWAPLAFIAVAIAIITFATFNTLEPAFDAEFARGAGKAMAKNPQVTPEMMEKMRGYTNAGAKYAIGVIMMILIFIVGVLTWLVGKLVGAKQSFQTALVVGAWAEMPRVLGAVIGGVQGLLMDPAKLTGQLSISLSPARFMDPDTANPLVMQIAGRFDLITLWVTVLLGIGLYVTGRVSKGRAVGFAILMWVIGTLPVIQNALRMM
ncbi:MAG: YIP1 family protein [bacterium]